MDSGAEVSGGYSALPVVASTRSVGGSCGKSVHKALPAAASARSARRPCGRSVHSALLVVASARSAEGRTARACMGRALPLASAAPHMHRACHSHLAHQSGSPPYIMNRYAIAAVPAIAIVRSGRQDSDERAQGQGRGTHRVKGKSESNSTTNLSPLLQAKGISKGGQHSSTSDLLSRKGDR